MKKNYFKSLAQVAILLCAPLFIASCDEFGTEDNPAGAFPSMSDKAVTIDLKYGLDPTYKRTAIAASAATIEYSSSDEKVATVDAATGVVTGVGAGTCDIIAKPYFMKNGSKLYTNEEVKYPVTVNDWRAQVKFAVPEALVNSADIDDEEFKFTESEVYPSGAGVTYTHAAPTGATDPDPVSSINSSTGVITLGAKNGVSVITAKITSVPTGYEMDSFKDGDNEVKATFTLTVKEGIAYVSGYDAEGEPIRTTMFLKDENDKDQYTKIDNTWITSTTDGTLEEGIYYISGTGGAIFGHNMKMKGNVTFILDDNAYVQVNGSLIADTPDAYVLNIYGQKNQTGRLHLYGTAGDMIMDFKDINAYGGYLTVSCGADGCGGFYRNSAINVYKGSKISTWSYATYGYGVKMKTGGVITVNGGSFNATGGGTDADYSKAVIGKLACATGYKFQDSADGTTWADMTGDTTDKLYVKSVAPAP